MPDPAREGPKKLSLFLSYAAEQLELADRLHLALASAGHEVFFDRTSLPPGRDYNPAILSALRACDLVLFLISPESVAPGAYALTELRLAREIWTVPEGHILPIMAAETPMSSIPPYLKAVSILIPEGDLVAEAFAAIDVLTSGWSPTQTAFGQARQLESTVVELRLMQLREKSVELDRQWELEKKQLMVEINDKSVEPTIEQGYGAAVSCLLIAAMGIFIHWLFACFAAAFGVVAFFYIKSKAEDYQAAQNRYQDRKTRLRREMQSVQSGVEPVVETRERRGYESFSGPG
jgi:hypothetical protein